jgi:hypothetical protein
VSKRKGAPYRSGRSPDWLKMKNPEAPAVKREAKEDWGLRIGQISKLKERVMTTAPLYQLHRRELFLPFLGVAAYRFSSGNIRGLLRASQSLCKITLGCLKNIDTHSG